MGFIISKAPINIAAVGSSVIITISYAGVSDFFNIHAIPRQGLSMPYRYTAIDILVSSNKTIYHLKS